jgi:hypothetical protein
MGVLVQGHAARCAWGRLQPQPEVVHSPNHLTMCLLCMDSHAAQHRQFFVSWNTLSSTQPPLYTARYHCHSCSVAYLLPVLCSKTSQVKYLHPRMVIDMSVYVLIFFVLAVMCFHVTVLL